MKKITRKIVTSFALTTALLGMNLNLVKAETLLISASTSLSGLSLQGNSGGNIDSKGCGFINSNPNHVLNVQERIDYMKVTVQGTGQPTLLIDGPGGRFCALAEGNLAEISGFWNPGAYKIFVGDRTGASHPFTIQFSR